ncbi:MocR-like pyridoxine biosynthesis transcription factor PdxR [Chitinophaga nivalis]|uniref:PLP-dependent aminotransferase family protein n=1 Tax=Chitinophaga nivalis TaxID=2991709 RepID=A0ABT3IMK4_9BACT|nr:PLP-dependent aminotransferase family protein [Chitinophaga nivalis]MCW3465102.1 PLP-dependent aminotransferase family protein [Chitinophaga nivalis]MCW3485206.1 PLP-dependent aminotransferase family protein [Chitinophaga nivalis]
MLRPWKTILQLTLHSSKTVSQQIADGIINEIKKGRLKPGMSLPGSRVLADDLGVNRKTVVIAYTTLTDEGWLSTAYKAGTFVSDTLPDTPPVPHYKKQTPGKAESNFRFNAFTIPPIISHASNKTHIIFNDGLPDARLAPLDQLAKAYKRIFQQKARWRLMGYGSEKGEDSLRAALCKMLNHDRGLSIDPGNILVTRGSQMALYLTAHTLVQPGDVVAMETPGYLPAWETFKKAGARMQPVKVDEQGICVQELEKICRRKKIKAVYVTPHHQFPTTVSMKIDRRLQLIALSARYGFAIVEDDYDHEYHFGLRSLLPLASMEAAANVIYISSLSKLISPAIRIGYLAGPQPFIDAVAALRTIIDRQGDPVMEYAVAELMEAGEIHKHARRAFGIYKERRAHMAACLDQYLLRHITYQQPEGGLAYWVQFRKTVDTAALCQQLLKKGVQLIDTERFSFNKTPLHALRLGYASLTPEELTAGIAAIASVL